MNKNTNKEEEQSLSLLEFLLQNPTGDTVHEVIVSPRLKNYPFKVKPITNSQYNEYVKMATKVSKKRASFDTQLFNDTIIIEHVIEPNFKDAELLKKSGCGFDSSAFINKFLLGGECTNLVNQILEISGFNDDMDDLIEDAKK